MSDALTGALLERLPSETTLAGSAREFMNARFDGGTIGFVDQTTISGITREPPGPVIAICDDTLQTSIGWLTAHPWLSHVMSSSLLRHPMAAEHLNHVMATITGVGQARLLDWVGPSVTGRRVRLVHAGRRADRLERMSDFLAGQGVGSRTIQLLRDVGEELLTNAFYDAPVAAGALKQPISRTQDVLLPDDSACDMVYGCDKDLAIVRVRDPFGSLQRDRLVEVLTRCARTDMQVEVDETMGGAGLGLWRIFSAASFVAISVVHNRHTEFLIGIAKRAGPGQRPFGFHLFFRDAGRPARRWRLLDPDSISSLNTPVTIVTK
jgi:hypothetical protein